MAEKFAATLAIWAFITVVIAGMLQSKTPKTVLGEGIGALVIFYVVGKICALSARRVIAEKPETGRPDDRTPVEGEPTEGEEASAATEGQEDAEQASI